MAKKKKSGGKPLSIPLSAKDDVFGYATDYLDFLQGFIIGHETVKVIKKDFDNFIDMLNFAEENSHPYSMKEKLKVLFVSLILSKILERPVLLSEIEYVSGVKKEKISRFFREFAEKEKFNSILLIDSHHELPKGYRRVKKEIDRRKIDGKEKVDYIDMLVKKRVGRPKAKTRIGWLDANRPYGLEWLDDTDKIKNVYGGRPSSHFIDMIPNIFQSSSLSNDEIEKVKKWMLTPAAREISKCISIETFEVTRLVLYLLSQSNIIFPLDIFGYRMTNLLEASEECVPSDAISFFSLEWMDDPKVQKKFQEVTSNVELWKEAALELISNYDNILEKYVNNETLEDLL